MARALARRERAELPDMFRRFFDVDWDSGWLRVEEFIDGTGLVVRAELPGIDPDSDVDLEVIDGTLAIIAERKETSEHKEKDSYRSEFGTGRSPGPCRCRQELPRPTSTPATPTACSRSGSPPGRSPRRRPSRSRSRAADPPATGS